MTHRFIATLGALVMFFAATAARADDDTATSPDGADGTDVTVSDAETWRAPIMLEAQTGVLSPVGILGAIVSYTPHERITLMAGAGMTLNAALFGGEDISWRVAAGVRHRAVYTLKHAFSMDYWISVGPWSTDPGSLNNRWDALVLLHVMPTWEYRHPSGFSFRMSLGAASNFYQRVSYVHTNTAGLIGNPICDKCNEDGRRYVIYPSTSMSLGYAF